MPYDPLQLQTDVDFITSQPQWQDEKTRRDYIRQVGVQAKGNLDNEAHTELMNSLWGKMDTRGKLQKAGEFVGTAVGEVVKSIPATFGAVGTAISDVTGLTDTGSGARLKAGVRLLVDTAGQRIKQLAPNDRQGQRDTLIESLREDIDKGAVPQGFEKWLAGDYDNKEIDDPETKAFVDAVVSGISRAGTAADKMGDIDYDSLRGFMESDRNPARADSDIPGEMGARQFLADYVATRDPQSWQQFKERVTETEAQYKNRLSKYVSQKPQTETVLANMPEGLEKDLVQRSLSMQESPIDLASALIPAVRGAKALQAAKAGGFGAAAGRFAKGAAIEGAQEAGTEALQDPRATAAQIAEAGALGAVGAGALEAGAAGVGAASRRLSGVPAAAQPAPETPQAPAPSAAESVTVESGELPLPKVLKDLEEKVKVAVDANADVLPATKAALEEAGVEAPTVMEETAVIEPASNTLAKEAFNDLGEGEKYTSTDGTVWTRRTNQFGEPVMVAQSEGGQIRLPTADFVRFLKRSAEIAPEVPVVEETVVTEAPPQEESPAAPPAEPSDATEGQPTPGGVGAPPVVTNEPQTPAPAEQPVSAAETPAATEPEAPLPETEKVVAPKAETEQGAGMTKPLPKRINLAGAEFDVVGSNEDGTLRVRNDNGDEFDTSPGEQWTEVTPEPFESELSAKEVVKMTREDFIKWEIDRSVFRKKLAISKAEDAIRASWKPKKPLPVGVSKVAAFIAKGRYTKEERKLLRDYQAAQSMRGAGDIRYIADVKGKVWDTLKAKEKSAPEAPPTQEPKTKPEDASKNQVEEAGGPPPVEGKPAETRPEGQAQEGAAQRSREGEEGVLTPEAAAPGAEPGAAALDAEYLAAVEAGDMAKAQRMVDEAAKKAGYNVGPVWHGRENQVSIGDKDPYVFMGSDWGFSGPGIYFTQDKKIAEGSYSDYGKGSLFALYARIIKPFGDGLLTKNEADIINNVLKKDFYASIDLAKEGMSHRKLFRFLGEMAEDNLKQIIEPAGFDGVYIENDTLGDEMEGVVFSPSQIKSADPVTYDDAGNVIPLSQRFNPESADIRGTPVAKSAATSEFGSSNTIFTKERAEEAAKVLKRKLGQTNVPVFDPELFAAATEYAGFLIEGGARKFGDFSSEMLSRFGEAVRPILKGVYSGVRELEILDGMDDAATVDKALAGETKAAEPAAAPVKPQAKAPTEPTEAPEQVGIANAVVDVARESLGLPPIERPVQEIYGDDQVWADAEAAMTADPDRGRYLIKSLIETPRQASTLETAILLRETVARTARLQQASIELVNAAPENKEMARHKYDDAVMALTEVQEASALAGAEQGRAFRARRFLADMNYNLASMTTTLQGAHQRKLTDAEVAEVMAESEKINKALKEVNDLKDSAGAVAEEESIFAEVVKEAQAEARLNAKETISTAKSEIKAGKSVREVINEKRDAARARLRKRGGSLNVGLNPADLVDYAIIAASYIAEGAVTLKDVTVKMVKEFGAAIEQHMPKIFSEAQVLKSELDNVAVEEPSETTEKPKGRKPAIEQLREDGEISGRLVYEMVKEKVKSGLTTLDEVFKAVTADVQTVVPEITERELRDLFSGYGKVKFPSQEELPKKVRELRRLAQLASAIEDAQNKIAPLRSGPQRDEASLAVREAQKELHRIMKEQGIQRAPGPRALKSALDAAKTRLRNQIEELEKQVKERKRAPADKRDIIYDQETKDLMDKRDALQATLDEIDPPLPPTPQELIKKALKELDKTIAELEKKVKERDISKPDKTETPITEQIQVKRDQRDALRAQLKEIRIEIEGKPYLTQEQINERYERNLSRQITELDRQIAEKDFSTSQAPKPENTAAIIRLKARRDTLREQRDALKEQTLGKKVKSEAERIDIAVKALEKSIDNLNERIRKGEVMPKAREDKTPQVAKVRNLRAERDSLRSVLTQMRKAQEEAAKDPEAEQLRRDRQYLESQIKNYQKKLASGDFRPQPKKAKEYSNKLADKTLQLQKLKEEWAEKVFIAQLNSRGKAAKAYDFGKQVLHTSRSVLTSFDVSAVFRQGGFIALGNPIRAFRNLKPMFESLASERAAQRTKDELESRPNFRLYQQSKLYLAEFNQAMMNQQEEAFMSRWLNKIPKILGGGAIRGSQRAYVTFLNRLRADTFDAMLGSLQKGPEPTTEEIKAIADYINIATGRGDLGKFQQAGEALNTVFFAPRLVASRFQILGGYPYFKASGRTKNLVLREYAKFLTGAALVYAIGMALQDEEDKAVEIDPRSSDFLKLRYGDTRVDPLGGLIQATVFLSRVASGEKKQLSGKVVPIRDSYRLMNLFRENPRKDKVRYGADNTFKVGANFLRSKFSPSFGAAVDILTGETVVGEKTTPTEVGYKMVMPITFGEAKETLEAHGMPAGPALTIISLFGMGVQTYD